MMMTDKEEIVLEFTIVFNSIGNQIDFISHANYLRSLNSLRVRNSSFLT